MLWSVHKTLILGDSAPLPCTVYLVERGQQLTGSDHVLTFFVDLFKKMVGILKNERSVGSRSW